jgi:hypothetical protein
MPRNAPRNRKPRCCRGKASMITLTGLFALVSLQAFAPAPAAAEMAQEEGTCETFSGYSFNWTTMNFCEPESGGGGGGAAGDSSSGGVTRGEETIVVHGDEPAVFCGTWPAIHVVLASECPKPNGRSASSDDATVLGSAPSGRWTPPRKAPKFKCSDLPRLYEKYGAVVDKLDGTVQLLLPNSYNGHLPFFWPPLSREELASHIKRIKAGSVVPPWTSADDRQLDKLMRYADDYFELRDRISSLEANKSCARFKHK